MANEYEQLAEITDTSRGLKLIVDLVYLETGGFGYRFKVLNPRIADSMTEDPVIFEAQSESLR